MNRFGDTDAYLEHCFERACEIAKERDLLSSGSDPSKSRSDIDKRQYTLRNSWGSKIISLQRWEIDYTVDNLFSSACQLAVASNEIASSEEASRVHSDVIGQNFRLCTNKGRVIKSFGINDLTYELRTNKEKYKVAGSKGSSNFITLENPKEETKKKKEPQEQIPSKSAPTSVQGLNYGLAAALVLLLGIIGVVISQLPATKRKILIADNQKNLLPISYPPYREWITQESNCHKAYPHLRVSELAGFCRKISENLEGDKSAHYAYRIEMQKQIRENFDQINYINQDEVVHVRHGVVGGGYVSFGTTPLELFKRRCESLSGYSPEFSGKTLNRMILKLNLLEMGTPFNEIIRWEGGIKDKDWKSNYGVHPEDEEKAREQQIYVLTKFLSGDCKQMNTSVNHAK